MTKEKLYNYLKDKSVSEMYKDLKSWDIPHNKILNIIEDFIGVEIIRFSDLKFKRHPSSYGNLKMIHSRGNVNGLWFSVVGGDCLHGDGVNTFEIWTEKMESEGLDPAGYCTPEEVEELIIDLF